MSALQRCRQRQALLLGQRQRGAPHARQRKPRLPRRWVLLLRSWLLHAGTTAPTPQALFNNILPNDPAMVFRACQAMPGRLCNPPSCNSRQNQRATPSNNPNGRLFHGTSLSSASLLATPPGALRRSGTLIIRVLGNPVEHGGQGEGAFPLFLPLCKAHTPAWSAEGSQVSFSCDTCVTVMGSSQRH